MFKRFRFLLSMLLVAFFAATSARSQSAASATVLTAPEAAKILPSAVFFRGQSAPVQARNSAGIKFADGMFVLTALVDNSGYSSSVQQKYQAYFITEVPIAIDGQPLQPGAYGVGFVAGHFGVLDIGNHDLFSVDATHDAGLKLPTPLQIVTDSTPGSFRLYQGRDYVVIKRP
jgi:hypothetical protein